MQILKRPPATERQSPNRLNRVNFDRDQSHWRWLSIGLTIGLTLLLGLMRLPEALWGDQALFLLGAKAIHNGALLYRDFWDLKQPGIYGLYALVGGFLGFSSVSLHLMDWVWMGSLGLILAYSLRSQLRQSWIAALIPWLCAGTYFAVTDSRQQMQVESLVGLPLYLVVWCNVQAEAQPQRRSRWLLLSGIAGGVVLLFKLMYLPLLAALWLIYGFRQMAHQRQGAHRLFDQVGLIAIGLMLPTVPVVWQWWHTGILNLALYTQLQHPTKMLQALPGKPLSDLFKAVGWVIVHFAPLILLAFVGLRTIYRRWNLLTLQLVAWIAMGSAMILAQRQSWWTYHFLLLLPPIAAFAGLGLDRLLSQTSQPRRRIGQGLAGVLCLWLLGGNLEAIGSIALTMGQSGLPLTPETQLQYQIARSSSYATAAAETRFLQQPNALPGDIYVIGDPVYHLLSGRNQAVPLIGWIPEMLIPEQWTELIAQLTQAQPNYIYVAHEYQDYLPESVTQFLRDRYQITRTMPTGVWHEIQVRNY